MVPSANTVTSFGAGVPLAIILAWVLSLFGIVMPENVQLAFGAVVATATGYVTELIQQRRGTPINPQAGFFRVGMALLILGLLAAIAACTGLRTAWQAADTADEQAYVLAEQYSSLVKEAADLAQNPATPRAAVTVMQTADRKAQPVIANMKKLRDAYVAIGSAENEEALQKAVNDAVLLINDLVRAVKAAKGEQ